MLDPVTVTAAVTTLFGLIAGSDAAKKLGGKFLDTTFETITPWFIKEDDTPETKDLVAYTVSDVQEKGELSPQAEKILRPRLEAHLANNPAAFKQLQDMVQQGQKLSINNSQTINNIDNTNAKIGKQFTGTTFGDGTIIN
jgi:hypothetical protein